jgi:S-adenosylmethionine synthetase
VQVAYAIGVAKPVSVLADTFGTGKVADEKIAALIQEVFPLTPRGIIDFLKLRRPIYQLTSNYGHFGRELDEFTWERIDKAAALRRAAGIK